MAISAVKHILFVWFILITACLLLYIPAKSGGDTKLVGNNVPVGAHDKEAQLRVPSRAHAITEPNKATVGQTIAPINRRKNITNSIARIADVTATHRNDSPAELVSLHKPASSDVRGNLGPASCITNETVSDWLADRWQAAKNMRGEPIPGEHWVEVDLQGLYAIDKILIDWEVAFSNKWTIKGKTAEDQKYQIICDNQHIISTTRPNKMHVIQSVRVPSTGLSRQVRYVRLVIHWPATRYGSSIWRFQIWGRPALE